MITDLLAACAYGENASAESVCCTIFGEEELIDIISNDEIALYRKRPFIKFLIAVYMDIQGVIYEDKLHYYESNRYSYYINMLNNILIHFAFF